MHHTPLHSSHSNGREKSLSGASPRADEKKERISAANGESHCPRAKHARNTSTQRDGSAEREIERERERENFIYLAPWDKSPKARESIQNNTYRYS